MNYSFFFFGKLLFANKKKENKLLYNRKMIDIFFLYKRFFIYEFWKGEIERIEVIRTR